MTYKKSEFIYIKSKLLEKEEKKQALKQLFNDKKISLKQYSREMNLIDLGLETLNQINPNPPQF
jgi:hypothetical protein